MKPRPAIDRIALSRDITAWLAARGLSYRTATAAYPLLDPAMLSRAVNGRVLSAPSLLALCAVTGRSPFSYLVADGEKNQPVTAIDPRETASCGSIGEASP